MLSAILLSSLLTLVSNAISPYHENIIDILISNALITSVINLLIMALLEAWVFFRESRLALAKTIELQKELTGKEMQELGKILSLDDDKKRQALKDFLDRDKKWLKNILLELLIRDNHL